MSKLIHERLRDWADIDADGSAERAVRKLCEVLGLDHDPWSWYAGLRTCARVIASEVEQNYAPLPRYEDGGPVQIGQVIGGDEIASIEFRHQGNWSVKDHIGEDIQSGNVYDRVKRPAPKPLGADGAPIEVGDTVYVVPGDHCDEYPLHGFLSGTKAVVHVCDDSRHRDYGRICIKNDTGTTGYPKPDQVTHREPDSLDKLLADTSARAAAMSGMTEDEVRVWADRLAALIEEAKR
ncbi:MAG: hypothetical protein HFJ75_07650 [Eggerthellaceae bacterium]|nr:hypothetical protein [Eggerthellaceae bacterium]